MKTTDYNTSVLLKELGFKAETIFWRPHNNPDQVIIDATGVFENDAVRCFDLETILEYLPEKIENSKYYLSLSKKLIGYLCKVTETVHRDFYTLNHSFKGGKKESLATTAGRLLVKLIQEGLIKLEE